MGLFTDNASEIVGNSVVTTMYSNTSTEDDQVSSSVRILHNVCSTTIAITGFIANFLTIIAILKSRLNQQTGIPFILNLMGNNCLACVISLPLISASSFMPHINFTHTECVIIAYITESILGTELLALILISLNRYILIVHLDIYHKIFSERRNTVIMIVSSWLVYPILLLFPVTQIWGSFLYDKNRFICHPFLIDDGFGRFIIAFALITTIPPLVYSYLAIVYKVWSSRRKINLLQSTSNTNESEEREKLRNKNDMQLVLTVILILTTFGILYVPFLSMALMDPQMIKFDIILHISSIYIGWLHCVINPIVYSVINSHTKQACSRIFCCKTPERPMDSISIHVVVVN